MPFADLRAFLDLCERQGELARVRPEVDPRYEIGAVCRKALSDGGVERNRALWFERVRGFDIPVVANALTSRPRYYAALETDREHIFSDWVERTAHGLPPRRTAAAPCKEVVALGEDADLTRLPIPTWNGLDGGPFITFGSFLSRDPDTGRYNMGVYRAQLHGPRTLGILAAPYRHVMAQARKAWRRGEAFPVAVVLGPDPAVSAAACAPFPAGVDELEMAGALRAEPVPVVPCETIPLEVPATAEIVIEAEMVAGDLEDEGPFGEFTGHYGEAGRRQVLRVRAITHRRSPLFEAAYEGRPPTCGSVTQVIPMQVEVRRLVQVPGLREINICVGGSMMMAIASLAKEFDGQAKWLATAILGTPPGRFLKLVIVVDEDVDPFNWTDVEWALATRMQPDVDVDVLRGMTGIVLDPSLPPEERTTRASRTAKMIVDATRPLAGDRPSVCEPDPETMARVVAEWEKYGIG